MCQLGGVDPTEEELEYVRLDTGKLVILEFLIIVDLSKVARDLKEQGAMDDKGARLHTSDVGMEGDADKVVAVDEY